MSIKFNGKLIAGIPDVSNKQDILVSGENIKTLNNQSILGSGNLELDGLPSQEGNDGKFLTTNGSVASWDNVSSIEPLTQEEYDRRKEAGELEEGKYYSTPDNLALNVLDVLYPVGSLYLTTNNICPLATLGIGTWILEATDRVLQGAGTRGAVGTTIDESLPNIKGNIAVYAGVGGGYGAISSTKDGEGHTGTTASGVNDHIYIDASRSSSVYKDNAPVQPNAYLINVYRRIS